MSPTCPISTVNHSTVPDWRLQPAVHHKLDPRTAHACIRVTVSHTIGLAVPLALPLAQRLSCQRHKSSTFGTGKRFGSEESSPWTTASPAECPGLTFLLHHYSHVPHLFSPKSRPDGQRLAEPFVTTDMFSFVCLFVWGDGQKKLVKEVM